jgi:hypothetical protein
MTWRDTRPNSPKAFSLTNAERQKRFRDKHKGEADTTNAERQKRFRDKRKAAKAEKIKAVTVNIQPDDNEQRIQDMVQTLSALKTAFDELATAETAQDRARLYGSIIALDQLLERQAARNPSCELCNLHS